MLNFTYYNPTKIIFGRQIFDQIGAEAARYGKRVLFHYGGGSIKSNGIFEAVEQSLLAAKLELFYLGGVVPNPHLSLVKEGIELCRKEEIDLILAVGGGSVIDSAKAISFGAKLTSDEDIWEDYFMTVDEVIREALPIGVVLTIPAAGSESSPASVITDAEQGLKRSVGSNVLRPQFAFLDPETNYTLPAYQTACGVSDILAHLQERYFTKALENDLSDRLLESAMRNVITNAPLALKYPKEYRYRAELMWTGAIAHNNLLDCGRQGDWASHNIEHELSGMFDLAHGAGLSIVFPAWMRYVYQEDIDRFVQYALRVWDIDLPLNDKELIVHCAIHRLEEFYRSIGMPVCLQDVEIGAEAIPEMAQKALLGSRGYLGNFKRLEQSDIEKILTLAL